MPGRIGRGSAWSGAVPAIALAGLGDGLGLLPLIGRERLADVDLIGREAAVVVAPDVALAGAGVDELTIRCHVKASILVRLRIVTAGPLRAAASRSDAALQPAYGQAASSVDVEPPRNVARASAVSGRANR